MQNNIMGSSYQETNNKPNCSTSTLFFLIIIDKVIKEKTTERFTHKFSYLLPLFSYSCGY